MSCKENIKLILYFIVFTLFFSFSVKKILPYNYSKYAKQQQITPDYVIIRLYWHQICLEKDEIYIICVRFAYYL